MLNINRHFLDIKKTNHQTIILLCLIHVLILAYFFSWNFSIFYFAKISRFFARQIEAKIREKMENCYFSKNAKYCHQIFCNLLLLWWIYLWYSCGLIFRIIIKSLVIFINRILNNENCAWLQSSYIVHVLYILYSSFQKYN